MREHGSVEIEAQHFGRAIVRCRKPDKTRFGIDETPD
jgi:hypothetical protein